MTSNLARIWHNRGTIWAARLSFAVLILTVLFTQVDFAGTLNTLRQFDLQLLIPIFVNFCLIRCILAYQMSLGLEPLHLRFSVFELLRINFIANFYSLVLPGDLAGGIAAWYKLSRPDRKGIEAGALLIYFRLLNLVTLLGIGLVGVWFDTLLSSSVFRVAVGVMFAGVVLPLLPFFSPTVTRIIEGLSHSQLCPGLMSSRAHIINASLTAFQSLPPRTVAFIIGLSLLYHILGTLNFYLLGLAVGIHQSVFLMGWLRSLLVIIQMVPVSVAGLGVREISVVFILRNYGIPEAQALGLSFAVVGMMAVGGAVGGVLEGWDLLLGRRLASHSISERQADAATGVSA